MKKNMNKFAILLALLFSSASFGEASAPIGKIVSFDSRDSGFHAIYLNVTVPAEGCDIADRATIDASSPGSEALVSTALTALSMGKDVEVRVDGCVIVSSGATVTTPKIIRISIK